MIDVFKISSNGLIQSLPELTASKIIHAIYCHTFIYGRFCFSVKDDSSNGFLELFCLFFRKCKGILRRSNLPFFQACGLWISTHGKSLYYQKGHRKKVLKSIDQYFRGYNWFNRSFSPECKDLQPFYGEGFSCLVRYTSKLKVADFKGLKHASIGL